MDPELKQAMSDLTTSLAAQAAAINALATEIRGATTGATGPVPIEATYAIRKRELVERYGEQIAAILLAGGDPWT